MDYLDLHQYLINIKQDLDLYITNKLIDKSNNLCTLRI